MRTLTVAASPDCAQRLKVLSDPTRLEILRILMAGPLHVGELNARLKLDQSLLSHHLKALREAGMVRAQRDGKAVLYSVDPEVSLRSPRKGIDLGCCVIAFQPPFLQEE
jgi:ArsR family transcriptional regulator